MKTLKASIRRWEITVSADVTMAYWRRAPDIFYRQERPHGWAQRCWTARVSVLFLQVVIVDGRWDSWGRGL